MPFSYKNGPSIFQRIMQNVLAPFLWIFTLVYIDDIIIFSLTLEDHISHLDQVFKAIEGSGVTLSITKGHFRYQSLLLLGQKVSRLGLSTHKEKVDTILLPNKLKDRHNLQVFLGMMVYFSVYILFYAWITRPLFNVLKGSMKWEWTEIHSKAFELCKQKVSRLGLSTHKEKVDAILLLDEPKDRHDLQVFLGMMVYFSAYIDRKSVV